MSKGLRIIDYTEMLNIIEKHQHYLKRDVLEWKELRADFSYTEISCMDLSGYNLTDAIFDNCFIKAVNFDNSNLSNSSFINTKFIRVCVDGADVHNSNFKGSKFLAVIFSNANFSHCNFENSWFYGNEFYLTTFEKTNLLNANFKNAIFEGVQDFDKTINTPYFPLSCPEEGSFIGFTNALYSDGKYTHQCIVKLEILKDAKRCSYFSDNKCRCDKAKVLSITDIEGNPLCTDEAFNMCVRKLKYKIGEIVEEPNYNPNRYESDEDNKRGIYFFIDRQGAVDYFKKEVENE